MSLDPARRAGLERSRATAIARDHFGIDLDAATVDAAPFGVVIDASDRAVVVSSSSDLAVLGGVLVWVSRNRRDQVDLVVEHHGGVHGRRAALVAPEITVHALNGSGITTPAPAAIDPPHETPADIATLVAMIERSGADAVVEDGIVRAEVLGLEVGRVVEGPAGSVLEVGVGRFDREAGALLHADRPVEPTLVDTIDQVKAHRYAGAVSHPINRIGRERWLRTVVRHGSVAGDLSDVGLVEPVPPRRSLLETRPASLIGIDADGQTVLVVCTVGVDLGVVPEIVDLLTVTKAAMVRLVLPERDRLPYLDDLITRLPVPVDVVGVAVPWA